MHSRALPIVLFFLLFTLAAGGPVSSQQITERTAIGTDEVGRVHGKKVKPLGCEGLRNGSIAEPGQSEGFTFQGAMGDVVDLVLVETIGFESSFPIATIESPTEGVLGVLNGTTLQNFVLPETGQYQITVTANAAGAFRIGRSCWPPTVTADGFLSCGDVLSDNLEKPGFLDYFTFAGQLNDEISISLVETAGFESSAARGTLFSPTLVPLLTLDADNVTALTLPETGNYTLRVQANDLTGTGAYNVGLTCFPPLNPVFLACGSPPQPSMIDNPGDVRFFTFDGGLHDVIEITLAGTGNAVPTMRVIDPLGSFVGSFSSDSLTGIQLGQTGTYTIEVRASTLAETGPFSIALACRNPLGPATALACGGMVGGTLLSVGEFDFYTFTGMAGDTAELTLTATAGFPSTSAARMRVFTPSGFNLGAFNSDSVNPISLPETGTYTVRVTSNTLVDTGTYDISLSCLPPAGFTHLGDDSLLPGDISISGETDAFTFEGEMGEVVEIPLNVISGFAGTICRGTLRTPSTSVVGTFDAGNLAEFTLPETGLFTFEIIAVDLISTGTYQTGLERRTNPGGGQDEDPESPALACGQLISGSIDLAGEVDYVRFNGATGDVVDISLVLTSGWAAGLPNMAIFSPSNVVLGGTSYNANTLPSFTLPETGTYAIRVRASNSTGTGTYNLGLGCRIPVGPVEQNLTCGDLASKSIDEPGELDYFTFDGTTGDAVDLSLVLTGGWAAGVPNMAIFSPSNVVLGGTSYNANTLPTFTLPETGTYVIRVRASNSTGTGTYNLGLECRIPATAFDGQLMCDTDSPDSISEPGEVDYYSFIGVAGDRIELSLLQTGWSSSAANMAIFSPSNVVLGGTSYNANTLRSFTLPESGPYAVRVRAANSVSTGSYTLRLECRPPLGPAIPLACGDLLPDMIEVPGQVDYFTFDGTTGDAVDISLVLTGGWAAGVPNMAIFSPSNVVLGGTSYNANTLPTFTLPETGTYVIWVRASNLTGTGTYNLGLECRIPATAFDGQLMCDTDSPDSISEPGEVDYYSFNGVAGDRIELSLLQSGWSSSAANMAIFSPSNVVLGGTSYNANTLRSFTLPETGPYAVRVRAANSVSTGSYTLRLECRPPLGAGIPLTCGDLLPDMIEVPGQVDYFTFAGTAGDAVDISLVLTGGWAAGVPNMAIFSPTNVVLGGTSYNANTLPTFTLPETGTYVIWVRASNLTGTGSYNLGLECRIPATAFDGQLMCDTDSPDSIGAPGEVDYYSFNGVAGDRIELSLLQSGWSSSAANMAIFSPSNVVLGGTSYNANTLRSFTLPETGPYAVRVRAANSVSTGSYTLRLECRPPLGAGIPLTCGDLLPDMIEVPGQVDYFTFTGTAGEVVEISLVLTGIWPAGVPNMAIFSPTNALLGGTSYNANTLQSFTLPETGTYVIWVRASNLTGTGMYNVGLNCP